MGQLLAILMVLGDSTSKGTTHPDDTTPKDVAEIGLRSSTNRTRYHPSDNDFDDIEPDFDAIPAPYTGTQVPGTTTLEISCGVESADLQGASRPKLDVMNSAGQSGVTTRRLNSDGQRQTDRLTPVTSTLQTTEGPSGKGGGTLSETTDERQNATVNSPYIGGESPIGRLREYIRRTSAEQQSVTTDAGGKSRHGQPITIITSLPKVIWEEGRVAAKVYTYAVKFPLVCLLYTSDAADE